MGDELSGAFGTRLARRYSSELPASRSVVGTVDSRGVGNIYTCIALQNFNHRPDTGLLHATEGNPIHCTKTTGGCIAVVYAKHSPTLWVTATCLVVRVVFLDNCLKLSLFIEIKR